MTKPVLTTPKKKKKLKKEKKIAPNILIKMVQNH